MLRKLSAPQRGVGCVAWLAFVAMWLPLVAHAAFGTAASPAVDASGAFIYQIPIRVAPGSAGVQPSLSLSYSSQGSNGIAGMGWSVSGLSMITRCAKTLAVDGARGGVNLDANDRLCLDGQRLILQSGTYGQPGAIYYPELFNGSRVFQVGDSLVRASSPKVSNVTKPLSYNSTTTGGTFGVKITSSTSSTIKTGSTSSSTVLAFRVQTKAGEVMEYAMADADAGYVSRMWLLVRVIDVKGNYWTVDYLRDSVEGEYLPSQISYTGNDTTMPVTAPYAQVRFEYDTNVRPDRLLTFMGGARLSSRKLLKKIQTFTTMPGSAALVPITEYRLTHATSPTTGRSRLTQVQECGWQATSSSWDCFAPITFGFATTTNSFVPQISAGTNLGVKDVALVDVNGDGRVDTVGRIGGGQWSVCLSNGAGFSPCQAWNGTDLLFASVQFADLNADGKADMVGHVGGNNWTVCLSTGSNFNCQNWGATNLSDAKFADLNGDGRADLIAKDVGNNWRICLSTGIGFSCQTWSGSSLAINDVRLVDMNGDGLIDMVAKSAGDNWGVCLSTGTNFSCSEWAGTSIGMEFVRFADMNGDGKTDVVGPADTALLRVCLSTGKGFVCEGWDSTNIPYDDTTLADVNGDGMADIVGQSSAASGTWSACLSTGRGFRCEAWAGSNIGLADARFADIDGDGRDDLVVKTSSSTWAPHFARGANDLITRVTSSLGLVTDITYSALSSTSAYLREFESTYPQVSLTNSMQVVTQLNEDNGVGGRNATTYSYGTAVSSYDGRGFLGFNWQQTRSSRTEVVARTTFHQSWPYTGMARSVRAYTPAGALMSEKLFTPSAKTLASTEPLTSTSCVDGATAGRPVVIYTSGARERSWEIDTARSPQPQTQTDTTIDCLGNTTQILATTYNGDGTDSGFARRTVNTTENWISTERWMLNRLKRSTVTHMRPATQ